MRKGRTKGRSGADIQTEIITIEYRVPAGMWVLFNMSQKFHKLDVTLSKCRVLMLSKPFGVSRWAFVP